MPATGQPRGHMVEATVGPDGIARGEVQNGPGEGGGEPVDLDRPTDPRGVTAGALGLVPDEGVSRR